LFVRVYRLVWEMVCTTVRRLERHPPHTGPMGVGEKKEGYDWVKF